MKIQTLVAPPYNMILILETNKLLSSSELLYKIWKSFSFHPNLNQIGSHHLLLITLEDINKNNTNLHPPMYLNPKSPLYFSNYKYFVNKANPNWYENIYKPFKTNGFIVQIMNIERLNIYRG